MSRRSTKPAPEPPTGWWAISAAAILAALRAVHAGGDPDLVYFELYANAEHESTL